MSNSANHNSGTVDHTSFVGRFGETPIKRTAPDTDALQFLRETSPIRHIYVHIPFCARICPYCAFYKDLVDRSQTGRFCEAILRELESCQGTGEGRSLLLPSTIYFGGGTPTALTVAQLELLLCGFRER